MFKKMFSKKAAASIMAGLTATAVLVPMAFASEGNLTVKSDIDALNAPMKVLGDTMTGAVPKVGVTIAAAGGALSWAMGTEQQVVKYATRAAMGGGVAMAAPSVVNQITGKGIEGYEF